MKYLLSPSLLSADFGHLADDIKLLNNSEADWIHIDIMDGVFVPNISFGFPVLKSVAQHATKPLDVHLMISNPERFIGQFAEGGAEIITIHYEGCTHLHRVIQEIKGYGKKAGVALNPHTPVSVIENIINDIDLVLIMSVNPGFAAQKFIPNTLKKVSEAARLIKLHNREVFIEVDGGVNLDNASQILEAGANVLVAGNAVFATANPTKTIHDFKII